MTLLEADPGHRPAAQREPRCEHNRRYVFASELTAYGQPEQLARLSPEERQAELDRVARAVSGEKDWVGEVPYSSFQSADDLRQAIARGELVRLEEAEGLPYRVFQQNLLAPGSIDSLPDDKATVPYTRPETLEILNQLGAKFHKLLDDSPDIQQWKQANGIKAVRFTVSSSTRSETYQEELRKRGSPAASPGDSMHNFGLALDITNFGYYAEFENGLPEGVTPDKFTAAVPVNMHHNSRYYNPQVIDILQSALDELDDMGRLRYINEVPFACGSFHLAVKPADSATSAA